MTTETTDYSLPPQWLLSLYKPDEIRRHVLVTETDKPDTYTIQEVDFHAVNLYTIALTLHPDLPVKGEPETFTGSVEELYEKLTGLDSKVLLSQGVSKAFDAYPHIPMAYGMSSDVTMPSMVRSDYNRFLDSQKSYLENPDSVGLAYDFINRHPVFWHVEKEKRTVGGRRNRKGENKPEDRTKEIERFRVVTDRGWQRLQFEIFNKKTKKGPKTTVTIESGPGYYHDYNLDVYASSFDEAIVQMAQLLQKHYDSHGGFTDKTKKEPNDNFFREADAELEEEQSSK